jgi:hypothetical protein
MTKTLIGQDATYKPKVWASCNNYSFKEIIFGKALFTIFIPIDLFLYKSCTKILNSQPQGDGAMV